MRFNQDSCLIKRPHFAPHGPAVWPCVTGSKSRVNSNTVNPLNVKHMEIFVDSKETQK